MNEQKFSNKFYRELSSTLTIAELYDYDKIKDNIYTVALPRKNLDFPPEEIPYIPIHNNTFVLIPFLALPCPKEWIIGYRITYTHLKLWNKTIHEIVGISTLSS